MSALISSWSKNVTALPESYVFPPEKRPGEHIVPVSKAIPVIDLGLGDRCDLAGQMIKACQEFGLFQVTNHGVSKKLMNDTASVFKEYFDLPAEDKASFYCEDLTKRSKVYTSSLNYSKEKVHFWKDTLQHPCNPLDDHIQSWPDKPLRYREVVGAYSLAVKKLSLKILDLICEGLGLEGGYFENELSKGHTLVVNCYPACPDPSLVWGAGAHRDPNLITILQQWIYGLQMLKDGEWVGVEPLPHAFVVNIGYQLEVISNGKLISPQHRVMTNTSTNRMSLVSLIGPSYDSFIEPAKVLISANNPPLFKDYPYQEFLETYFAKYGDAEAALKSFKLKY